MKKRILLKIHGHVQGVNFRYRTQEKANQLSLAGYIVNNPDRTVSIEAEGEETDLEKLIVWSREGSPAAKVDKVETQWLEYRHKFNGFGIHF